MIVMEFFKTDRYKNYGIGYIDPARMNDTIELVGKYMGIDINFKPEDAYTSEFCRIPHTNLTSNVMVQMILNTLKHYTG